MKIIGMDMKLIYILLVDPENNDFRPIENSSLINSGILYENLDINFTGDNPDIGA